MKFEIVERGGEAKLKVVGVGGGGGNATNRMIEANLQGVEFITINADLQALKNAESPLKVQIGSNLTKGLGAGGDPEIGRQAALEDRDKISEALEHADMVFITAGFGGGTGTGAAPIVAEVAREHGALSVAIVTKPFMFEGRVRAQRAEEGLMEMRDKVDTMIIVPNQKLLGVIEEQTPIVEAFRMADDILRQGVQGISDLITIPGLINLDFADVRTVMTQRGTALMGVGSATGERRALRAAQQAISCPLLEESTIQGARGLIINISGGSDLSLFEVNEATTLIHESADENANIIFGAVISEEEREEVRVTVIATGFNTRQLEPVAAEAASALNQTQELFSMNDLDTPTFVRRSKAQEVGLVVDVSKETPLDELDIPTFIRKKQDSEVS